jgi:hypothetical protein
MSSNLFHSLGKVYMEYLENSSVLGLGTKKCSLFLKLGSVGLFSFTRQILWKDFGA